MDISKEIRLKVKKRNTLKGVTFEFEVGKENFYFMESWFEKPDGQEMADGIVNTE
ncbi:hypothetical protein [uncultured Cyclobacterium sp.]|uniref:hypothetical protein n=1 Tax=uncultured Cyclobacterium sp. TaxID=453820 RepID=UPI0030EEC3AE